nr:hypothetical protein [Pandoravirus massiliensis]
MLFPVRVAYRAVVFRICQMAPGPQGKGDKRSHIKDRYRSLHRSSCCDLFLVAYFHYGMTTLPFLMAVALIGCVPFFPLHTVALFLKKKEERDPRSGRASATAISHLALPTQKILRPFRDICRSPFAKCCRIFFSRQYARDSMEPARYKKSRVKNAREKCLCTGMLLLGARVAARPAEGARTRGGIL